MLLLANTTALPESPPTNRALTLAVLVLSAAKPSVILPGVKVPDVRKYPNCTTPEFSMFEVCFQYRLSLEFPSQSSEK